MKETTIKGYHAHVYYDNQTKEQAQHLREALDEKFGESIQLGRWHDRPIGPHPEWSYQVAFATEKLSEIVPWLMLNRNGLNLLVHPLTGDDLRDHRDYAMWLGKSLNLNLDALKN